MSRAGSTPQEASIPVVVLGGGGVGKSCLTLQYVNGQFVDRYDATIEDIYRKRVTVDGKSSMLMIVDTAGQEAFMSMREQHMKCGSGFVLVYSITDSESFHQLKKIYSHLWRVKGEGAVLPCVLVGNKFDLAAQRAVPIEEGQQFAKQLNCSFVEVSAKDRDAVVGVFEGLVRAINTVQSGGKGEDVEIKTKGNGGAAPAKSEQKKKGGCVLL